MATLGERLLRSAREAREIVAAMDHTEEAWDARVKGILKAELKRKGVTYKQLVDRLADLGVKETEPNIRNKLARGKFTAVFFIQCLDAIGIESVRLR